MDFWHFAPPNSALAPPLEGVHDPLLVLLSITIACFAGVAALSIVNRIIASGNRRIRLYWLLAGAVAMGCGIWAMHFTGMLAFTLPIDVHYDLELTLISLIPAILGSGAALYFMAHRDLRWWQLQLGALLMAAGIGTMHYSGMEAMHMNGMMHYDFAFFCLSLIVAHVLAMAAIYIRFVLAARLALSMYWIQPLAALVMGNAVSGMHYTAMAAAQFYPGPAMGPLGGEFSNLAMGAAISGFSVLILMLAMLATRVERRIALSERRRRAEQLRANTILNITADGILALDEQGSIQSSNRAAEGIFGCPSEQISGKPITLLIPEFQLLTTAELNTESNSDLRFRKSGGYCEVSGRRADGSVFPLELTMNSMPTEKGDITVLSLRDITERKRAQEIISKTEERFRIVARVSTDAIWDWDLVTDTVWWNEGMLTLFGHGNEEREPDSRSWTRRIHPDDKDQVLNEVHSVLEEGGEEWTGEYRFIRKDGSIAYVVDRGFVIRDSTGKPVRMVGGMNDITERKEAEAEIHSLAFYDPLTKLPNRALLQDRLQHAIATTGRSGLQGALLFIDLDDFKTLNDSLGHDCGDQLLQLVAQRLRECVRESDTVARLGGDEFVVILENLNVAPILAAGEAEGVGGELLNAFHQPFLLGDFEHYTKPSIGATLFSNNTQTVEELLKQADLAMYQAKAAGGNTLRFFDPEMQIRVYALIELEAELHQAVKEGQFLLYYQPQVDSNGRVCAAEALVRWQHPRRGLILPGDFIAQAETCGLILPLGRWVLESACRQLVVWAGRPETAELDLAVNVSANEFRNHGFVDEVLALIEETGINPHRLKLELTENVLVTNMADTIEKMTALRAKGLGFILDDFGTGYSSLYYLKHLPLEQLKIDQSFIKDVLKNDNDAAITRTIITLAQSLSLTAVAEGVETKDQRDFLALHGCHTYQGYLFSRPVAVKEFDLLMTTPLIAC